MQTENQHTEAASFDDRIDNVSCPSCQASMVRGMRFCRMCGYRLGEGIEEYAETQLLGNQVATARAKPAQQTANPQDWGAMSPMMNTTSLNQRPQTSSMWQWTHACHRLRMSWVMWVIVSLAILTATGAASRGFRRWRTGGPIVVVNSSKSFLGVDGFETGEMGGAFITGIAAPDTPVARADLLGGDVIIKFDGKQVADEDAMREILAATPVGKTVEVVYIRDGETKTTMLTTIAEKSFRGLAALDARPGGRGYLGVQDFDRVRVGDSNIYGVKLGDVSSNRPADIAGLKEGDIVIEFNGKPVRTEGDMRLRIYEAVPGSVVKVVLMRGGERMEIPVKIGRGKD